MSSPPPTPSPAQRLKRLKVIVKQLSDLWPDVLQRQALLQALGRRPDLHEALRHTYAAHISNMVQNVLVLDLMRELGALVLDPNSKSASVHRALRALRDKKVIAEIEKSYRIVRPLAHIGQKKLSPEDRKAIEEHWNRVELEQQLRRFEKLRAELVTVDAELTGSVTGTLLWTARSKSIAHYDVVSVGDDWKLWRVEGTSLTWGQINEYIDFCTRAIHALSCFVREASFDFEDWTRMAREHVDEYVTALALGAQAQKRAQAEQRQRLIDERVQRASPAAPTASAGAAVKIETVNAAILKLAGKNRDKALAVLATFGVRSTPKLSREQYQAVIDLAEEELAKLNAASV